MFLLLTVTFLGCVADNELELCGVLEIEVAEQAASIAKLEAQLTESRTTNAELGHLVTDIISTIEYEGSWQMHDACEQALLRNGRIYRYAPQAVQTKALEVATFELEVNGTISFLGKQELPPAIVAEIVAASCYPQ